MELKYLIARANGKRTLFMMTPEEETALLERIPLKKRFWRKIFSGVWADNSISFRKLARALHKVERWVMTTKPIDSELLSTLACKAHLSGVQFIALDAFLLDEIDPIVPATSQQLIHLLARHGVHQNGGLKLYTRIKYLVEPILASLLFLALSPIFFVVAVMVKLTSPGPVIYRQERVGANDRIFRIYKFRSMIDNAEKGKAVWAVASKNDPSLTPIGGFLRSSHLDELPQLWNIMRGDLSFIGPRPERPEFVRELTAQFPLFQLRTLIKPGLTGWAQIKRGYANTISDSVKKLELDLFYLMKHSPRLDFKICIYTVAVLLGGGTEEIKRSISQTPKVSS